VATQDVQTPVVHVAQLLYWQQRPATHWFDVHQSSVVQVPPLALSGQHWLLCRHSLAWHDVQTPVVQVVQPAYWQHRPAVHRPETHQLFALQVPPFALSA
jgi:hypothetical protein